MKFRLLMCTVLLALFVVPAFADSVTFTNNGLDHQTGQFSVSSSGISVTDSIITSITVNGIPSGPGNFGTLSFDTGSITGSLSNGSFSGGAFLFSSVTNFSGTVTKIGKDLYDLVGTFSGIAGGFAFKGTTNQIFSFSGGDNRGDDSSNGCWRDLHGTTNLTTTAVPEPSTLTFLGTGLIALAGAVRRKLAVRV